MQRHLRLLVAACIWRRWGDANRETEGLGCLSYLCFDANGARAGLYVSTVTELPLCLPFHSFSSQTSVVPSLPPSGPRLIMTPPTHSWDPQPFLDFLWPHQSVCRDSFYVSLSRQKHRNTPAVSLPIAFSMILNQGCTLSRKWWPKPHFWLLCFDWSFVNFPNFSHICARSYTKLDLRHKAKRS